MIKFNFFFLNNFYFIILYLIQQIYSKLNDADSLKGIIAVHDNDPSPQEMILLHEVNGQLQVRFTFCTT